jgi:hypothetical protein
MSSSNAGNFDTAVGIFVLIFATNIKWSDAVLGWTKPFVSVSSDCFVVPIKM